MAAEKYKVLITNPVSESGHPDVVIKGVVVKGYVVIPVEAGIFEVYYGKKYLGEATTKSQIKKLIERDGADAPVLIQNPNGGYEQMAYTSPSKNPKKKRRKTKSKRKTKKKAKRRTKKKATGKKTSVRKKKRISKAKKKVKKAKKKVGKAKRKAKSAKKKVSKAKKAVRKAKGALSKAKRSKNPTANPRKRRSKKKVAKKAAPRRATMGDVNAYVRRVTGKKF